MKKTLHNCLCLGFFIFISLQPGYSQKLVTADSSTGIKTVKAGHQYKRSGFYEWLMGTNYRKEWTTPVRVPILLLDTAMGGLKAYKEGGGHQTKSLHVKTKASKEYAVRSVDKTLGKVLPEILHHTFLEAIVNDEVSMSHPYAAASVPTMAQKAGIYHTIPSYVFLPKQTSLDTFNEKYGDRLYLFEQRLDGNWEEADNLGNFKKFIDTYDLLDTLHKDNNLSVNQHLFVKSRLFDMFLGDWDRHEDQWRWGLKKVDNKKVYQPIPQDRDQVYFKYNGKLLKLMISAAGLKYFQAFDYTLPDVRTFNYEERNLDRVFANQMTLADWTSPALELQQLLTDDVIEKSISQLPPEIFTISGKEIISKLKSRRNHLHEYAAAYYNFIAKQVEVVGSKGAEVFEINRINDNETAIKVFSIENNQRASDALYSRIFKTGETQEIRLYGLSGEDKYVIKGSAPEGVKVRIIGGTSRDSILNPVANKAATKQIEVYDDPNTAIENPNTLKLHLSSDTSIHSYKYMGYIYNKNGVGPNISYNYEDRLFVGLNAKLLHQKWRKSPFAYKQQFRVNYSISQHAVSLNYKGLFPKAVGKWDIVLGANFDAVRWTKFFGLGNETPLLSNYNDFYRMRSSEWLATVGLNRVINHNDITVNAFFQSSQILDDKGRFVSKVFSPAAADFKANNFVGGKLSYLYDHVNDSIVPTRGITFSANASYHHNLTQNDKDFSKYYAMIQAYVPFGENVSLSIKTAGSTVVGNPLFYQNVSIGGPETLRGYRLERFWGKTGFYDANELRYIANIKSYVYNGKLGVLALYDQGRVWLPGENSNLWHHSYGGGIIVAPFNKLLIVLTYAKSPEMKLLQLRVGRSF